MASVRLLKDRKVSVNGQEITQKAGEVVSTPFFVGRDLIAAGLAESPTAPPAPAPAEVTVPPPEPPVQPSKAARMKPTAPVIEPPAEDKRGEPPIEPLQPGV